MLWLLLACVAQPAGWQRPEVPDADECARYDDPDTFGYCIATSIRYLSPDAAAARCAIAGSWENECRYRFVSARLRDIAIPPPGAMGDIATDPSQITRAAAWLDFCADDDCRFQVVDRFRDADLTTQLRRCEGAGRFANDCAVHAVESWQRLPLTEARAQAVWDGRANLTAPARSRSAAVAGWAFACLDLPCPPGANAELCTQARGTGMRCPAAVPEAG